MKKCKGRHETKELVVERLKSLLKQTIVMNGVKCQVFSTPDKE